MSDHLCPGACVQRKLSLPLGILGQSELALLLVRTIGPCCCCWRPTRLLRPWDSPGKNTGVGCHFLLQCMKLRSESEVIQLCLTLRDPMDCIPAGSTVPGILQARTLDPRSLEKKLRISTLVRVWKQLRSSPPPPPSPDPLQPHKGRGDSLTPSYLRRRPWKVWGRAAQWPLPTAERGSLPWPGDWRVGGASHVGGTELMTSLQHETTGPFPGGPWGWGQRLSDGSDD